MRLEFAKPVYWCQGPDFSTSVRHNRYNLTGGIRADKDVSASAWIMEYLYMMFKVVKAQRGPRVRAARRQAPLFLDRSPSSTGVAWRHLAQRKAGNARRRARVK